MFYPAGTLYALAEETYRLGLYGLCNTEQPARRSTSDEYGGKGMSFQPAVDPTVFHARGPAPSGRRATRSTVFVYARPGHWRNCWEMASLALEELKRRLGDRRPDRHRRLVGRPERRRRRDIKHLGLLDYRATGELYRTCDVGLALTVSKHPSYLPLELMACGVPVVAFDNPWGHWLLARRRELACWPSAPSTAWPTGWSGCASTPSCGERLSRPGAAADIAGAHSDWDAGARRRSTTTCATRRARLSARPIGRVLLVTAEPLGERHGRAGDPRARARPRRGPLGRGRPVTAGVAGRRATAATPASSCPRPTRRTLRGLVARRAGVVVLQGDVLNRVHPWLAGLDVPIVVDAYDPFHLEQLEQARGAGGAAPAGASSATPSAR